MITNSFSDFKTDAEKIDAYNRDINIPGPYTVRAHREDKLPIPLKSVPLSKLEHVAGLWRVQNEFPYEIEIVRKKAFVIGDKLPHAERTHFEFYKAYSVNENCYGKYIGEKPDYIVAKYPTNRGVYSAYGRTIEDVRAYLGIKLYDEFQDVIHKEINSHTEKTK